MTPEQIQLVQTSFAKVAPISDQAAELFYGRLFEIAPSVKPMFPADMREQRKKLMGTLAVVVGALSDLAPVLPVASTLAKKHVGYGVEAHHYDTVGEALLWTLARAFGPEWTHELEQAWTAVFAKISGFMIAEAYGHPAAAE
ncbi:globin family protein [Xanthobacteraceae bacterium Astr-EGSB]|uniref:globin family protein n=1 Tax=Astrobacterium formosum TaxID=3069710 RepID=UPI0027B351E2|nr:globin family protein [Xanthobacteraceae bacterium Astr-EGSB]